MSRLPVTRPDTFARANGISRNGSTVFGWNDQQDGYRSGVIWLGGWGLDAGGFMAAFVIDMHSDAPTDALIEAHGTVGYNDLVDGPFAGIAVGTPVTLSFVLSPDGFELKPGRATSYPIRLDTFRLEAGDASETLVATTDGPSTMLTNDYPMSDGIHLFATPTASGQAFEFELFNPGGNLFDSDDLNHINRTFGPELFEKMAWQVMDGDNSLWVQLDSVGIHDVVAAPDAIFASGFEP
jgi:hypothetical protein